jgi:TIR domain
MWDFFIAYARRDAATAEAIYHLLASHATVFLDSKCLVPGDDWDLRLRDEQENARITLVLVSSGTRAAHYERDEIASAVQLARTDASRHRVIPVVLTDGPSAAQQPQLPYGLRTKHAIFLTKEGLDGAVAELLRIKAGLPELELPARPTPSRRQRKSTQDRWWLNHSDLRVLLLVSERFEHVVPIWRAALSSATNLNSGVHIRRPEEIVTTQHVLEIIAAEYACILLPLTLPHYNSLRLAEYAHRLKSRTRVVTVTTTDASPAIFTPLFDGFIGTSAFGVESLTSTLSAPLRRDIDAAQIVASLERILASARCFTIRAPHFHDAVRQPTLRDYEAAASGRRDEA